MDLNGSDFEIYLRGAKNGVHMRVSSTVLAFRLNWENSKQCRGRSCSDIDNLLPFTIIHCDFLSEIDLFVGLLYWY